jgi:hypothetical protein
MSDFDAALERLLTDPSFAAALAEDPDGALAGYRLDEAESDLLRSQVATDTSAAASTVEARTTKSSTFGLLSSFADWGGAPGGGTTAGPGFTGGAGATAGTAAGPGITGGAGATAGTAAVRAADALGDPGPAQGLGPAPGAWGTGGMAGAHSGLGDAPDGPAGLPGPARTGLGDAPDGRPGPPGLARTVLGDAPRAGLGAADRHGTAEPRDIAPPPDYRNRVDADGDGTWDEATYRGRADGGVDILVDLDGDGRADFVGHDVDKDRVVDSADFDKNRDGVFEKRMYDDDGDGWLDRTVRRD